MRRRERGTLLPVDAVPAALAVGRCVEVWAKDGEMPPTHSAMRRFDDARGRWLSERGVAGIAEQCALVPFSAAWSADRTPERLSRTGHTLADLPALRDQASRLLEGVFRG